MLAFVKELFANRRAFSALVSVQIKLSVATARLGWIWWIIDPLILMAVYYFLIHVLFGRGGDDYHLFVLCGIVNWQFFSRSLSASSSSISRNSSLIKQVGMPLSILVVIPAVVQIFFAMIGIIIVTIWSYETIGLHSLSVVPLLLLVGLFSFALGLFLSVTEVYLKDIKKLLSYVLRAGFFLSPVLYHESRVLESESIPEVAKLLFSLNPIGWVITETRSVLLYGEEVNWTEYFYLLSVALLMIQLGLLWLRFNSNKIAKTV